MKLFRRWSRSFLAGIACGFVIVLIGRYVINETSIPDRMLKPLLLPDTRSDADAIVILGGGVVGECVPNLNATRRVLLGVRMWRENRAPVVAITGGPKGVSCPVAVAMAEFAREVGLPASSLIVERESETTWENGEFTAPLLRRAGAKRLLVVTDRLHMRRAAGVFARLGFDVQTAAVPVYEGHVDNVSMLSAGLRELAALTYYRMKGRVARVVPADQRQAARFADMATATTGLLQRPAGSDMAQKVSNPTGPVVVLGASYAKGWDVRLDRAEVVNVGVAGEQSFEMLARFDRDVVAHRPRAVILWGFINDIFRARDMELTLQRVRDSYTQMLVRARANGIEPILATEVTVRAPDSWTETVMSWIGGLMGKVSYQDQINRNVMTINRWLIDLAAREQILILDLHGALADERGRRRREFMQADGSHISPDGYEALRRYATPILNGHFAERPAVKTP
jgi:uncharacterized SAM-binding protein YcdF (DUF218 family)/lysophospholipase L1-like esterase